MSTKTIKQKSSWPVIQAALSALAEGQQLPSSMFAAIADRLRSAIEASDATRIQAASTLLEDLYRTAVALAPDAVQSASRGDGSGDMVAGYTLGKLSFAQLLAARVADTRADQRFVEHLRDQRYLPYVQALFEHPMSVSDLSKTVGKRIETVSRKLAILRSLGIVVSRKQGNVVVNMLTLAASTTLEALGLQPAQEMVPIVREPDVRQALDKARETLSPHMRETPHFKGRTHQRKLKAA